MRAILLYNRSGLTLIEVMIALFVLSVGILAVAALQIISTKSIAMGRVRMVNSTIISSQLDQLHRMPYDHQALQDKDDGFFPENPDFGPIKIPSTQCMIEWEVDEDFPEKNMKRITIRLRNYHKGHGKRPMTIDYLKSKK